MSTVSDAYSYIENSIGAGLNRPGQGQGYDTGYGGYSSSPTYQPQKSTVVYVNLIDNPEQFTGYGGPSAQRVWRSILQENCFGDAHDTCLEKRVFQR